MSINNKTGGSWYHRVWPKSWSFKIDRILFMWMVILIYHFSRTFPARARTILQRHVARQLPDNMSMNPHFEPLYKPWDQRLCFTPDGDFFQALQNGNAFVETGQIKTITGHTIVLESGQALDADIIVTATGLRLSIGGRINFTVDNKPVDLANKYAWRSALLQDVPNMAFMLGYVNASWTLGAETTARLVCRILQRMRAENFASVTPKIPEYITLEPRLIWNLNATYVEASKDYMPMCGHVGPWTSRTNYFLDLWRAKYGSITRDLKYTK
jgi:cation diffusion facilitator CzcD-associated flavoprotein CzcO